MDIETFQQEFGRIIEGGEWWPRASAIARIGMRQELLAWFISRTPEEILHIQESGTEWGRAVHAAVQEFFATKREGNTLQALLQRWAKETGFCWDKVSFEHSLLNTKERYTGTADLVLKQKRGLIVGEIKTHIFPYASDGMQLASYAVPLKAKEGLLFLIEMWRECITCGVRWKEFKELPPLGHQHLWTTRQYGLRVERLDRQEIKRNYQAFLAGKKLFEHLYRKELLKIGYLKAVDNQRG
jgi:hypothetical protein